jgi:hypothetical protein
MFQNTDHISDDLESLKKLIAGDAFLDLRIRIVDNEGNVVFFADAPIPDINAVFGDPTNELLDEAYWDGIVEEARTGVGYTLMAYHKDSEEHIVSLSISRPQALEIMNALWPDVDFWCAPGGSGITVSTEAEAAAINKVLGNCYIRFNPGEHYWMFHVHLV